MRCVLPSGILLVVIAASGCGHLAAQEDDAAGLVPFVLSLLQEPDKDMRALGLEQVRTQMPGTEVTKQLAAQLPKLTPPVQAELVRALTDRGDPAARPAIVALVAASDQELVRQAGLRFLGYLGGVSDVPLLIGRMETGSEAERAMAQDSLMRLPGDAASRAITSEMNQADPARRVVLMEVLVARRAFLAADDLVRHAVADEPQVRAAAMEALSQLGGRDQVAGMVQGILAAEEGRERDAAEKAVMLVCHREEDIEPLLVAMRSLDQDPRRIVLPTLGRVGGPAALRIVQQSIAAPDRREHEAGVRALCHWPDASVAPELLKLVRSDTHDGCRIAALRALIRVAPLPDGRTDQEKLELLKSAWPLCWREQERHLVLRRAAAIRIPETLRFLVPFLDQPEFSQPACQSIVELAHHRNLRDANQAEFTAALKKVQQVSRDATVIDRAERYLKGQTWTGR